MRQARISSERFRDLAREQYQEEGRLEIDDNASISRAESDATGVYVQAWVWVEIDEPEEADN